MDPSAMELSNNGMPAADEPSLHALAPDVHATNLRLKVRISLTLMILAFLAYLQVGDFHFVHLDDDAYVVRNEMVLRGMTADGLAWAFTTTRCANWHPLTWLSFMLDCQLFASSESLDLDRLAGSMHLVNLLLHVANTVVLFLVLARMTGNLWPSAMVAALFALHPLHVESVAWVSERKDVLSALFGLLSIGAYARYVERPNGWRLGLVAALLGLGLLAKPMLVTLPFALVLLDYWPLGRFTALGGVTPRNVARLLWEKRWLLVIAAASCVMTIVAQERGGALRDWESLPFRSRMAQASLGYVTYGFQTVWPVGLACFYPYPSDASTADWLSTGMLRAAAAFSVLCLISFAVVRWAQRFPFLPVGWFWFLGMLVPVVGIVQVGGQAHADRYTYLPLIGLFIMAAWGVPRAFGNRPHRTVCLSIAACIVLAACLVLTFRQASHWRDSRTLFERALAVTENNAGAHWLLGRELRESRLPEQAKSHLESAARLAPHFAEPELELGRLCADQRIDSEAIRHYSRALAIRPDHAVAHYYLGNAYVRVGDLSSAADEFAAVVRLTPGFPLARHKLALLLPSQGTVEQALAQFEKELPGISEQQRAAARAHFLEVLQHSPRYDAAREALNSSQADRI
jgi:Tfp pilus assembly protein PilF